MKFFIILVFVAFVFYTTKFIYYGKEKCNNRFFNSYIPIILVSVLIRVLSEGIKPGQGDLEAFFWIIGLFLFAFFTLTFLAKLIFRGIQTNSPTKNTPVIRFFKVAHIFSLLLISTIIGSVIGILAFFVLWSLQYIILGEKHPFFAFKRYRQAES